MGRVKTAEQIERNRRMQAGRNAKRKEREALRRAEEARRLARAKPSREAAKAIAVYRREKKRHEKRRGRELAAVLESAKAEFLRVTAPNPVHTARRRRGALRMHARHPDVRGGA